MYGLNEKYELVVIVVDWRARKVVGRSRLVHSGNLAIREISNFDGKKSNIEFISCG